MNMSWCNVNGSYLGEVSPDPSDENEVLRNHFGVQLRRDLGPELGNRQLWQDPVGSKQNGMLQVCKYHTIKLYR